MKDLIDRQAAIDAIAGILTSGQAMECQRRINALPPAQPEKQVIAEIKFDKDELAELVQEKVEELKKQLYREDTK